MFILNGIFFWVKVPFNGLMTS